MVLSNFIWVKFAVKACFVQRCTNHIRFCDVFRHWEFFCLLLKLWMTVFCEVLMNMYLQCHLTIICNMMHTSFLTICWTPLPIYCKVRIVYVKMFVKSVRHYFHVICYGCEVCPFNKTEIRSLQYVVKSCFSKIFQTRSDDIIAVCMEYVQLFTCGWCHCKT